MQSPSTVFRYTLNTRSQEKTGGKKNQPTTFTPLRPHG